MTAGRSSVDRRAAGAERKARRAAVEDPAVVMEAAAAFLAVRPRSTAETRRRLEHLGYPAPLVRTVVERLTEMGYLDDDAFARAWLESRDRARPRGESALRRELSLKGIDRAVVDQVLADRRDARPASTETRDSPDAEAARRLLERRASAILREPDARRRRQKAYALLARNGFDPETCRDVAAAWADRADAPTTEPE